MFKRTRYQHGCVTREERKSGPDIWVFRWRELSPDGTRINRKTVIGTTEQYRTEAAARRAADALRIDINRETPRGALNPLTVGQLVEHFKTKELGEDSKRRSYSTRAAYRCYLANWVLPRWGTYLLREVKTVAVEDWLGQLSLAAGTKAKIRNLMSALFNHAIRYELLERNPITLVRQSAKRERVPEVLNVSELKALLGELQEPYRTMVFLAASTGLRVSELLGLQWQDVDFDSLEINLRRAVVHQVVGEMKTEASKKPLPLDSALAEALLGLRKRSPYNRAGDWVFASPQMDGKQPHWPEHLRKRYIRPAAERCGIKKTIGFHTFRHSYATLLKANGEDIKTVQESLRHANSRVTLDTYTQAVTPLKRQAQTKVVRMILPGPDRAAEARGSR